jgi:hypothetical protein
MTQIIVSDHAVLRWLERCQGVDLEAVRRAIREKVREGVKAGARCVRIDGLDYVLEGTHVVTVKPRPGKH